MNDMTLVFIEQSGNDVPMVFPIDSDHRFLAALTAKRLCRQFFPGVGEPRIAGIMPARFDSETGHILLMIEHKGWEPYEGTLEEYLYPDSTWTDPYAWVTTCWAGDGKSFESWKRAFARDLLTEDLIEKRLV